MSELIAKEPSEGFFFSYMNDLHAEKHRQSIKSTKSINPSQSTLST